MRTLILLLNIFLLAGCYHKIEKEKKLLKPRTLYVDLFDSILDRNNRESKLLSYAKTNQITTLLLYNVHKIYNANTAAKIETNSVLANFIKKAKNKYNIEKIGVTGENLNFFKNIAEPYNNSRLNSDEKIDIYNLEFEFWTTKQTALNAFCNSYLKPNGLPCNKDGAFDYFISTLKNIKKLAKNNSHKIITETYVGRPTSKQAKIIGSNVDRVRISAYRRDPNIAFEDSKQRIQSFKQENLNLKINIIFSTETNFMGEWVQKNGIEKAEEIFIEELEKEDSVSITNKDIEGFTYFSYFNSIPKY